MLLLRSFISLKLPWLAVLFSYFFSQPSVSFGSVLVTNSTEVLNVMKPGVVAQRVIMVTFCSCLWLLQFVQASLTPPSTGDVVKLSAVDLSLAVVQYDFQDFPVLSINLLILPSGSYINLYIYWCKDKHICSFGGSTWSYKLHPKKPSSVILLRELLLFAVVCNHPCNLCHLR